MESELDVHVVCSMGLVSAGKALTGVRKSVEIELYGEQVSNRGPQSPIEFRNCSGFRMESCFNVAIIVELAGEESVLEKLINGL